MADHEPFIGITQDATVQALKSVSDNILLAVEALNIAVAALSTKTIKVDTDHVNVNNFPATQPVSGTVAISNPGLTDAELRATAVPVSFSAGSIATDGAIEELQLIEQRLKLLNASIQRLSFDNTSQLRVSLASLPTLSTLTTGNVGLGDCGKPATAILMSRQAFDASTGANFIRS